MAKVSDDRPAQGSLFSAPPEPQTTKPEGGGDARSGARAGLNARRLRTLMLTTPLVALEANKLRHGPTWAAYDLRTLQLQAIQTVVEHMGLLEGGVTQLGVAKALTELARTMAPENDPAEHPEVAQVVLDWLLNTEDRDEFKPVYVDVGPDGAPIRRQATIEILRERQEPDGSFVLRASVEAINLLLGPLSEDVADAQRAEERLLDDYIADGRFDAAVDQARRAQFRSIQYAEHISRWLSNAQQDISRLDWSGAVKEEMDAALSHIGFRLVDEDRMRERASSTAREIEDPGRLQAIARVLSDIKDCHSRHTYLHTLLLDAGPTFRREQERQRFARPVGLKAIALIQELDQALQVPLTRQPESTPAGAFFRALMGPVAPPVFDLVQLVGHLNAPPREISLVAPEIPETTLVESTEPTRFPPEVQRGVAEVLATAFARPRRLSALLREARSHVLEAPELAAELMRLLVVEAFAPEGRARDQDGSQLLSEHTGETLDDEVYRGDDLIVAGVEPTADGPANDATSRLKGRAALAAPVEAATDVGVDTSWS